MNTNWIKCSERLPGKKHGQVLAWLAGCHYIARFSKRLDFWLDSSDEVVSTPTHWMPLPEPPEEQP